MKMSGGETKIRVGIVGTGFAAGNHLDALSRLRNVEVVAVAGRNEQRAHEFAGPAAIARAYGSYQDLLADDTIDAVHNCTPNHLHAEVSMAVLDAGKHLLSEKPLAVDSRQSLALVDRADAARASGIVSGVCFNYRHYPLVAELKEITETQRFGAVHFIHGGYLQDWLLYQTDWSWRVDSELNGPSRAVADIGSHWLDLVQYIAGARIVSVFADLGSLHPVRRRTAMSSTFGSDGGDGDDVAVDTEDFATVAVRFDSGARGSVVLSQVSAGHKNCLFFTMNAGSASCSWNQEDPNRLWIGHRDEANRELVRDPALLGERGAALAHFPGGHEEGWPDALRNLFADFYRAVEAQRAGLSYEPSFATFEQGHQIVQLVEAITASHESRGWVEVGRVEELAI
ncbi:MAG: hypothetical protein QOI62_3083 [Solirubrobacteraceae bacterium]|jgi:predicted dehydrogenase|nr:hypothetical protein [Solirubrobacteraceae bacterium]MEA2359823.1 hypothetical protein [Solirubrobacteraceae bacterium]MEA2393865.1 hypothetical protein [Solirubrobacteraceae bacterium]